MDINNIGKTIADLRKKNNMSQQELANKLNVSNKTISKWECGNGIPDITVLSNIANLFNLTLDELINYEQQPKTDEIKEAASNSSEITSPHPASMRKLSYKVTIPFILFFVVATSLLLYFFIPRTPEITTSNIFDIDQSNKTISCVVNNEVDRFSFGGSIKVPRTNAWGVYYDLNGSMPINSQTVQLQAGNNTFYLVVENNVGRKQTYEVVIRRKPLYVVSYNTNGGQDINNEIIMEGDLATYKTPVKDGYIFDSWDFDFSTPITSSITINASWIAKKLVITYHSNNDTNNQSIQSVTYNEKVVFKDTNEFIKTGYTLTSWNTKPDGSGTSYCINQNFDNYNIPNDIELYAQWAINKYTISANPNIASAGVVSGTGSFDYGSTQTLTATTNAGYTWDGWYSKDNVLQTTSQSLTVTLGDQSQEYIAKWTANKYDVSFDVNGGNQLTTNTKEVVFDLIFVFPVATRTEATFIGWFDSQGKQYTDNQGISVLNWDVADDTILYAHYKINEYQVALSENIDAGGVVQGAGLKEYGSEVTITAQTKAGYSFLGWYSDGNLVSNATTHSFEMPNYPISYVAKWKANTYTITLNVNGGTALLEPAQDVTFDSSFSIPTTSRVGYTFAGWYTGANGTERQITDNAGNSVDVWDIANDTTVYAKWNVINYKINYVLNGGENHTTNPSTYNIEDDDIALKYPTKKGYTFNGWVISGATTAEKTMIITSGSTGEKTYAASWIRGSSFVAISTPEELQAIQNNTSGYYYLTRDIDLSSFDWTPVDEFNGILDGNGFAITNFTLSNKDIVGYNLGFIIINNGLLQNLKFLNVAMTVSSTSLYDDFAVLSTRNYGTIKNCKIEGLINGYGSRIGLIAHSNQGEILNCTTSGTIDGNELASAGICYSNHGGLIQNCYSDVKIVAKGYVSTIWKTTSAGICANNSYGNNSDVGVIENCYFAGTIENGYEQCGIAYNYGECGNIKNCFINSSIGATCDSFGKTFTIGNVDNSFSVQSCYYSNSMTMPSNTEKTGTAIDGAMFKNKEWLQTTLGYREFISEVQLWLDDSNVWVFTEDGYPKLYWEVQ